MAQGVAAQAPTTHKTGANLSLADRWSQVKDTDDSTLDSLPAMEGNMTTEFLLTEEKHPPASKSPSKSNSRPVLSFEDRTFLAQSIVATIAILAAAAFIHPSGAGGGTEIWLALWKDVRKASVATLVVHGVTSLYHHASQLPQLWPTLVTIFCKPDMLAYIWDTVLPTAARTARTMITAELWNRFFARLLGILGTLVLHAVSTATGTASVPVIPSLQGFWASTLKRGTRRLLQKPMQRHLQAAFNTVWDYLVDSLRAQVSGLWQAYG